MTTAVSLRDYQSACLDAIDSALVNGRSTIIESATGTGKTTIFSEWIRRTLVAVTKRSKRALVIAHRRELIDQAAARLRSFGLTVGIERGTRWSSGEPVVVASVQTLRGARLSAFPMDEFDVIVIDEGHHATSASYRAILDHFPNAKVLLVTATPDRPDGVPMSTVTDTCAFRYGIADAVRDGYLVPARGLRVEVAGMDLSKVRQHRFVTAPDGTQHKLKTPVEGWGPDTGERLQGEHRDLHIGDLGKAALEPAAVDGVIEPLLELAADRKTIVFAVNKLHARALVDCIRKRGGTADFVDSSLKIRDRERVIASHKANEFQYLVNVGVLLEGYDDQEIECVAFARPTQSRVIYAQGCGRGLRLLGDTIEESIAAGKSECLVVDFVGVSCQFTLVGPDDVLAGALVEPTKTVRSAPKKPGPVNENAPEPKALAPAPPPARYSFTTQVVDLLRTAAKKTAAAGRAVKRGAVAGAKKARGWLGRLFFG